jgi:hypothetical protein
MNEIFEVLIFLKNHLVHDHVVRFREGVGDDLEWETDADFESVGAGLGEQAVVKPAATAEAVAAAVEGEAGADESVDFVERHFRRSVSRFEDAVGPGLESVAWMKGEVVAVDFRIDPVQLGMMLAEEGEINLARQCGVDGNSAQSWPCQQPLRQSGTGGIRVNGVSAESLPHAFAERGLAER